MWQWGAFIAGDKLEGLIHRIFGPARFNVDKLVRFGRLVVPCEWFMVPLFVSDESVERIRDRTIVNYVYDPKSTSLMIRAV